jgi:hypothetical protein
MTKLEELRGIVTTVATNQKVMSNNIDRLEKATETLVASSPKIAVMEVEIERLSKLVGKVLWYGGSAMLGVIGYLTKHNIG